MASEAGASSMDLEDSEKIDSIVDEFFSFIDDDFHLYSEDGFSLDFEANDLDLGDNSDPRLAGGYTIPADDTEPPKLDVDSVLDEHFSFLKDEYDYFNSFDRVNGVVPSQAVNTPPDLTHSLSNPSLTPGNGVESPYENVSLNILDQGTGKMNSTPSEMGISVSFDDEDDLYEVIQPRKLDECLNRAVVPFSGSVSIPVIKPEPEARPEGYYDKSSVYLNPNDTPVHEIPEKGEELMSLPKNDFDVTVTATGNSRRNSTTISLNTNEGEDLGSLPNTLTEVSKEVGPGLLVEEGTSPEICPKRWGEEEGNVNVSDRSKLKGNRSNDLPLEHSPVWAHGRASNQSKTIKMNEELCSKEQRNNIEEQIEVNHSDTNVHTSLDSNGKIGLVDEPGNQLHGEVNHDFNISDEVLSLPSFENDLKRLHSLDLEIEQLESIGHSPDVKSFSSSFTDPLAEAINTDALSLGNSSDLTFPSSLTLNTDTASLSSKEKDLEHSVMYKNNDCPSVSGEVLNRRSCRLLTTEDGRKHDRPTKSISETSFQIENEMQSTTQNFPHFTNFPPHVGSSPSLPVSTDDHRHSQPDTEARSASSSLSGVIRRSMRRMKHIRLSGKRNKRKANMSEETEVRREVPVAPPVGLPSLRSPSSSAVILPTLLASFSPNDTRGEDIPYPEEVSVSSGGQARVNVYNETAQPSLEARSASQDQQRDTEAASRSHNLDRRQRTSLEENSAISRTRLSHNDTIASRVSSEAQDTTQSSDFVTVLPVTSQRNRDVIDRRNDVTDQPSRERTRRARNNRPRARSVDHQRNNVNNNSNNNNNNNNSNNNNINNNNNNNRQTRSLSGDTSTASGLSSIQDSNSSRRSSRRNALTADQRLSRSRSQNLGFLPPKRILWPHNYSGLMAAMAVTLNLFNISRFAVLGAKFGWPFPVQWIIISLVIGLPLMAFHSAVGQSIGASVVDMWVISPLFKGVGVSLLLAEAALGIYCCVPVAWLFTYLRDSFHRDNFRCFTTDCLTANKSREINILVPDYLRKKVLHRVDTDFSIINSLGSVQFDLAFNIALIWVITFLALSRGVRTYGKVCYLVFLLPLVCYISVTFFLICSTNHQVTINHFEKIFVDRHSWMAASREAFLVWGLHGAVLQQMAASNKKCHALWRDTTVIALLTILGLGLASMCGLVFTSILKERQLAYIPSSFENNKTNAFMISTDSNHVEDMGPMGLSNYVYDNFYVGIRIREESPDPSKEHIKRSGYNSIRFLTEMFPALLIVKDQNILGLWPPIFYLGLLLFGLAHLWAVWHTVVQGLIRFNQRLFAPWETFLTFCSCLFAYSASLLMATEVGIHIIYFFDYVIGCVWWLMILQLIMVFAILFVRGKPYTAHVLAKNFFGDGKCCLISWITAPVAFSWTIMVPVGLLVLSISSFKTGNYREVFAWESCYWSIWTCQLSSGLQLFPLLLVPLFGLIQTCRYLANPKRDLFERIQHLYRPPVFTFADGGSSDSSYRDQILDDVTEDSQHLPYTGSDITNGNRDVTNLPGQFIDPPPKYTPPPSYSTATGSGLQKFFNRSLRDSVRRLRNTLMAPHVVPREDCETTNASREIYVPPPDYLHPMPQEPDPPGYATLDPRRGNPFQQLHRGKSSNSGIVGQFNLANPSVEGSPLAEGRRTPSSRGEGSPQPSLVFTLGSSRSFSRPSSARRASRLRRTLSSSLRRSSRCQALNAFSALNGDSGGWVRRPSRSLAMGGDIPARSLSSLMLSMQSEA